MKPSEIFEALLCNPDLEVVIGTKEDQRLLKSAIKETKDLEKFARHIHRNRQDGTDYCAICGEDIRHSIHLLQGEI